MARETSVARRVRSSAPRAGTRGDGQTRKAGILSYARAPSEDRLPVATRRSVPRNDFAHACATPSRRYFPWLRYRPRPLAVSPAPMSVGCTTSACRITEPARRCDLLRCRVKKDIPRALGRNFQTPWAYDACTKNPAENWSLRKKSLPSRRKRQHSQATIGRRTVGRLFTTETRTKSTADVADESAAGFLPFRKAELRNRRTQFGVPL